MKKILSVTVLFYGVVFAIIFLSVGYSAFGSKLLMSDIVANVRIAADIRVTSIVVNSVENGGISNFNEYNVNSISAGINLPNQDSTVTYRVQVTNFGNVEMGILDILGLPSNIEYELANYVLEDRICAGSKCTLGATKTFRIKFKYSEGAYDSANTNFNLNLHFAFRKYYKVTYSNIENNSYKTLAIENGNLKVIFVNDIPSKVNVTMGGVPLELGSAYTYTDGVLTVNNVTGDIVVSKEDTGGLPSGKDFEVNFRDQGGGGNGSYSYAVSLKNITNTTATTFKIYVVISDDFQISSSWGFDCEIKDGLLILSKKANEYISLPANMTTFREIGAINFKTSDSSIFPLKVTAIIE